MEKVKKTVLIYKYSVDAIDEYVKSGRFESLSHFIRTAITNQLRKTQFED